VAGTNKQDQQRNYNTNNQTTHTSNCELIRAKRNIMKLKPGLRAFYAIQP